LAFIIVLHVFIIVTGNTAHIKINKYNFQILLTNYKHTEPSRLISHFCFQHRIYNKREHTYMYYKIDRTCNIKL